MMEKENKQTEYTMSDLVGEEAKLDYRAPIYLQLRELVRSKIDEGEYLPGTAIPSENKLAETFGINRLTVRNAVEALVNEGILQRVQGKGVFVVGDKYEEALEEYGGFISSAAARNKRIEIKEQTKTLRYAGDKYANLFCIAPDDLIFFIRHLNYVDKEPLSVEEIYIPMEVLPQLSVAGSTVFTMQEIFNFYGIELCSMRQSMELVTGELKNQRKMLNVPEDIALLMLECNYRDQNGRLVEYSRSFVRSDKETFRISLHN